MPHDKCPGWFEGPWTPGQCHYCWSRKDPATQRTVGGVTRVLPPKSLGPPVSRVTSASIPLPTLVSVAPCIHLGEPVPHQSCGCKEKVRECALYGQCTSGVRRAGIRCCEGCDGFASSDHYDTSRRHLLYYVFPVKDSNWKWNCDQVKGSLDLFNGRRVVAVGTASSKFALDPVQDVVDYLGPSFDVIEVPQRKRLGEVLAFPDLIKRVKHIRGPQDFTLYCHAKGTTRPKDFTKTWTDLMYRSCFNWAWVEDALRDAAITGPFQMPMPGGPSPDAWFYSGTFFWMRNSEVFSRPDCTIVPQYYGGVEHWPWTRVPRNRASCIFFECSAPTNLYDPAVVAQAIDTFDSGRQRNEAELLHSFEEKALELRTYTAPEVGGDGIVTLTDSTYFPSTWVQIHRLRALGCTLPVICYTREDLPPLTGVTYKRFPEVRIPNTRYHWAIKPWLILDSGFRHCMFLDADVYPVKDPTDLMGRTTMWGEAEPGIPNWRPKVFGLPPSPMAPNTGVMVWDVFDGYQVLELWKHLNRDSDYWFPRTYSDQETLQAAAEKLGYKYQLLPRCKHLSAEGCYLHGDYFVHRIVPKFKSNETPVSCPSVPDNDLVMKEYERWKTTLTT